VRAPDFTYRYLYPKDVAGPTLQLISRSFDDADTAVQIESSVTGIPEDTILVLTNVTIQATPGATQACNQLQFRTFTRAGLRVWGAFETPAVVADKLESLTWSGEIWVPGSGAGNISVTLRSNFDAGAASNRMFSSINGYIIPKANVAIF